MNVNYDRVCRLCLSSRGELLPIFPTTSSDDSEPSVLASKIKDCVAVQIHENDDLPTNVCRKCMENVNNWHIFKKVCERTQNKLQSMIKKDGSQLEEVKIKSEPLSDGAYDEGVIIDGSYPDSENVGSSSKIQPEGPPILASLGLTPRSDKKYVDPRMDWHRAHAILDMIQDDAVIDSLQSAEECDVIQTSDHDSDSDADLESDIDNDYVNSQDGYKCKDFSTISKDPVESVSRNYFNNERKLKTIKLNPYLRPKHAWQKLFTDDILDLIVSATNDNISQRGKSVFTSVSEIKTLIGILYFYGIMRPTHQKCSDLWDNEFGTICIRNSMSFERFQFLLEYMSFFDKEDNSIIQFDTMKRIRKMFEIFAMNCRTAFAVQDAAVIDEIIVPVWGPCPFRYDIKKKSLKHGMKVVLLVDPSNFYINNLDVITDPYFGPSEIVCKLVNHLAGTGKTIVMDSWFTSLSLLDKLKTEYQLFCIAALNPKSDFIPPLFLSKKRESQKTLIGFMNNDVALSSSLNLESKSVNVLTNEPKFYKKPHSNRISAVSVYKKNQTVVEVADVLMHYYTTMQNTNNWTLSLFFTMLNIASINAQVIWGAHNSGNVPQRRLFIKELALSLLETTSLDVYPTTFKEKRLFLTQESSEKKGRCVICASTAKKRRRDIKQICAKCGQFVCREHVTIICHMCGQF